MWGALSGGDIIGTGIAAWGKLVILGDAEGNIHRWDTSTGRVTTIATHQVCIDTQCTPCIDTHFIPWSTAVTYGVNNDFGLSNHPTNLTKRRIHC